MNFHPSVNSQQLQHLSQVDETFILRQPDEILLQQLIFATNTTSNFYNLSLVCKKINTLMKNEALIAFFFAQPDNFSSFGKKVVQFLTTLAAKNENIKNIPFRLLFKSYDLDDEALIKLGTLTKLQSINIARFHQISKSGFDIFFTNCQNLKHFECNQDLDYETLMTLVKTNKQLKSFDFGKSSEEEFITLLPYLRNLESLTFPHREHAYRTSLSENACLALVKSCPNLKEFKIFKFDRYPGDSFMSHFVKVCSNTLQSINLYAADNNQLIAWATRFTSLKKIELMAPKCTDVGIQYLAKNCPHLEIITLINGAVVEITDLAIEALSKHCINLKFLSFETSSSVSLTCLKSIGNRLHDLQTLIIVDNKNFVNKECINKGLKAIAEGCKKLKKIAFAAFRNEYDDEHLIKLIQANPYLEFAAIYCQSDSVINAFDKHCPCLNYLIIKTMFNSLDITIETLEKLVKNRPTISIEYKNKMLAHKGKLFLKA